MDPLFGDGFYQKEYKKLFDAKDKIKGGKIWIPRIQNVFPKEIPNIDNSLQNTFVQCFTIINKIMFTYEAHRKKETFNQTKKFKKLKNNEYELPEEPLNPLNVYTPKFMKVLLNTFGVKPVVPDTEKTQPNYIFMETFVKYIEGKKNDFEFGNNLVYIKTHLQKIQKTLFVYFKVHLLLDIVLKAFPEMKFVKGKYIYKPDTDEKVLKMLCLDKGDGDVLTFKDNIIDVDDLQLLRLRQNKFWINTKQKKRMERRAEKTWV